MNNRITAKIVSVICMATVWAATLFVVPATTGCTSNQLKAYAVALQSATANLSAALKSTNPQVAADLADASSALSAVVTNWDTTTAAGKLNTIAAGVESALALVPTTSPYVPLIAIAITAVDSILAITSPSSTAMSARSISLTQASNLAIYRARANGAVKHRILRSQLGDYKAAWNGYVKDHPELGVGTIR